MIDKLYANLPILIHIIELIGIFIVSVGAIKAFIDYLKNLFLKTSTVDVRYNLGTAMVTGLEFKMAAEILKTVTVSTIEEVIMLASIIILREILSHFIKKDMTSHESGSSDKRKITGIKVERE